MSKYLENIVNDMKNGATLNCTEGKNYKAWLEYSDGTKKIVRKDTADKISIKYIDVLKFTKQGVKF